MKTVTITQRRLKCLEYAEATCRAFREAITMRVVDVTQADWDLVMDYLFRWLDMAPKRTKYLVPQKVTSNGNTLKSKDQSGFPTTALSDRS